MRAAARLLGWIGVTVLLLAAGPATRPAATTRATTRPSEWAALFDADGEPRGFRVTAWNDVSKAPPAGARWSVKDGVLSGSTPRGTWLVSEAVYADFELELDFRIGPMGNSGVGLRFPDAGDPAFDGTELQIIGARYRGEAVVPDDEKTGALYQLAAPKVEVYRAGEWNHYAVVMRGPRVTVHLNGHLVQDLNLDEVRAEPKRGKAGAGRPREGHIGFQELSRGDSHVEVRRARVRRL